MRKQVAGWLVLVGALVLTPMAQAHVSLHHWTAVAFIRGTARIVDMDTETAVKDPALISIQVGELGPFRLADRMHLVALRADPRFGDLLRRMGLDPRAPAAH